MGLRKYKEIDMPDKFMKPNVDLTKTGKNEGPEYCYDKSNGIGYCDIEEEKKEEKE
jgi:hypothetical protein